MAQSEEDVPVYKPKDAIGDMVTATMIMGGAGLTLSAVKSTLTRQNIGAWAVFTRTGGTISLFGEIQRIGSATVSTTNIDNSCNGCDIRLL